MAFKRLIIVWGAAIALALAASTVLALTVYRILIPAGATEFDLGQGVIVIQTTSDVGLSLTPDGEETRGVLQRASAESPAASVHVYWRDSGLTILDARVSDPVEFTIVPRKETGHGEM